MDSNLFVFVFQPNYICICNGPENCIRHSQQEFTRVHNLSAKMSDVNPKEHMDDRNLALLVWKTSTCYSQAMLSSRCVDDITVVRRAQLYPMSSPLISGQQTYNHRTNREWLNLWQAMTHVLSNMSSVKYQLPSRCQKVFATDD